MNMGYFKKIIINGYVAELNNTDIDLFKKFLLEKLDGVSKPEIGCWLMNVLNTIIQDADIIYQEFKNVFIGKKDKEHHITLIYGVDFDNDEIKNELNNAISSLENLKNEKWYKEDIKPCLKRKEE